MRETAYTYEAESTARGHVPSQARPPLSAICEMRLRQLWYRSKRSENRLRLWSPGLSGSSGYMSLVNPAPLLLSCASHRAAGQRRGRDRNVSDRIRRAKRRRSPLRNPTLKAQRQCTVRNRKVDVDLPQIKAFWRIASISPPIFDYCFLQRPALSREYVFPSLFAQQE